MFLFCRSDPFTPIMPINPTGKATCLQADWTVHLALACNHPCRPRLVKTGTRRDSTLGSRVIRPSRIHRRHVVCSVGYWQAGACQASDWYWFRFLTRIWHCRRVLATRVASSLFSRPGKRPTQPATGKCPNQPATGECPNQPARQVV